MVTNLETLQSIGLGQSVRIRETRVMCENKNSFATDAVLNIRTLMQNFTD